MRKKLRRVERGKFRCRSGLSIIDQLKTVKEQVTQVEMDDRMTKFESRYEKTGKYWKRGKN